MMKRMVCALALLVGVARADDWTKTDTAFELGGLALHVADWGTTRHTARHPLEHEENNPILGKQPSLVEVDVYFAATAAAHMGIAYLLPQPYRRVWQFMWIGVEGACVVQNLRAGVSMTF